MSRSSLDWRQPSEINPSLSARGTFCKFDVNPWAGVYAEYFTSKPFETQEQVKALAREFREAVSVFRGLKRRVEQ